MIWRTENKIAWAVLLLLIAPLLLVQATGSFAAAKKKAPAAAAKTAPVTPAAPASPTTKTTPQTLAKSFQADGITAMKALKWSEAEDDLRQSAALNPKDAMTLAKLGVVLMAEGKPDDAAASLHQAWLAADPKDAAARKYINSAYALNHDFTASFEQTGEADWFAPYVPTILDFIRKSGSPQDDTTDCPNLSYLYHALAMVADVSKAPSFMQKCAKTYPLPADYPPFAPQREYLLVARGQLNRAVRIRNHEVVQARYLRELGENQSDDQWGPIENMDAYVTYGQQGKFDSGCIYADVYGMPQKPLNPVYKEIFPATDLKAAAIDMAHTCALSSVFQTALQAYADQDMRQNTRMIAALVPGFAQQNAQLWHDDVAKLNDPEYAYIGISLPAIQAALTVGNIDAAAAINDAAPIDGTGKIYDAGAKNFRSTGVSNLLCSDPKEVAEMIAAVRNKTPLENVATFYTGENKFADYKKQEIGGYSLLSQALGCYFAAVKWSGD